MLNSLKRGQGQKVKVTPRGLVRIRENKEALFAFLASEIRFEEVPGKFIVTTITEKVFASPPSDCVADIDDCNHEEADSRMILHAFSWVKNGKKKICIRTSDTDVVMLAVHFFIN